MNPCNCHNETKVERNGHTSTCNRETRKAEERAKRVKIVQKEINKVSPKMAAALAQYMKLKKSFLEANPNCAVYPERKATDIHHMAGRNTTELLLNTDFWCPVSRDGHREIEMNPTWAKEKGFSLSRLSKEPT